jgi:hypothetical protein
VEHKTHRLWNKWTAAAFISIFGENVSKLKVSRWASMTQPTLVCNDTWQLLESADRFARKKKPRQQYFVMSQQSGAHCSLTMRLYSYPYKALTTVDSGHMRHWLTSVCTVSSAVVLPRIFQCAIRVVWFHKLNETVFCKSWRWRQYVAAKPSEPHGVTTEKTNIDTSPSWETRMAQRIGRFIICTPRQYY